MYTRAAAFALAVCLLGASQARADDDPEPPRGGLRKLQGDWQLVTQEAKGKKSGGAKGSLSVKGDKWILGTLKDKDNPPTIKVDTSKRPMTIELLRGKGKAKG